MQVTGDAVLAVAGVAAVGFLAFKLYQGGGAVLEAINPASSNNVVYRGLNAVVGEANVASVGDRIFAAVDLLNPFNDSDAYARQVWGFGGL